MPLSRFAFIIFYTVYTSWLELFKVNTVSSMSNLKNLILTYVICKSAYMNRPQLLNKSERTHYTQPVSLLWTQSWCTTVNIPPTKTRNPHRRFVSSSGTKSKRIIFLIPFKRRKANGFDIIAIHLIVLSLFSFSSSWFELWELCSARNDLLQFCHRKFHRIFMGCNQSKLLHRERN